MSDEKTVNDHPRVLMPPPLIYLGGILVGYGLDQVIARPLPLPGWMEPPAIAMSLMAMVLIGSTLLLFHRHHTTVLPHKAASALVTSGPFRISRNPIYLGDALILAGLILWWQAWAMVWLLPAFVVVIDRRFVRPEEARLRATFGAAFDAYAARVRRWL